MQREAVVTSINKSSGDTPGDDGAPVYRVMLIDDHPVVREGLRIMIEHEDDLSVCCQADNPGDAEKLVKQMNPDIVILDLKLGTKSGLALIPVLQKQIPDLPVIIFSIHDESLYAERAIRAGARGYVMKDSSPDNLLFSLRRVLAGEVSLSNTVTRSFIERSLTGREGHGKPSSALSAALSKRELQIFRMIGKGLTSGTIAAELELSVKTIDSHRANIKRKLFLKDGAELVRTAIHWVDKEDGDPWI